MFLIIREVRKGRARNPRENRPKGAAMVYPGSSWCLIGIHFCVWRLYWEGNGVSKEFAHLKTTGQSTIFFKS
jgi:hypothetical protein